MVTLDKEQVGGGEAAAAFAVKPQQAGTESSIEAQREANAAAAQGRANASGDAAASGGTLAAPVSYTHLSMDRDGYGDHVKGNAGESGMDREQSLGGTFPGNRSLR